MYYTGLLISVDVTRLNPVHRTMYRRYRGYTPYILRYRYTSLFYMKCFVEQVGADIEHQILFLLYTTSILTRFFGTLTSTRTCGDIVQ
jgi:hypothetical protein